VARNKSGLEIRAGSSDEQHRKNPHLAEKEMVGTRRLELLTSTVSKFPVAVLTTTYWLLETAEQRESTRKPDFSQVILQVIFMDVLNDVFQDPRTLHSPARSPSRR